MVRHEQSLIDYIELVTGLTPRFGMAPPTTALPLYLREQFEFAEVELFGHRMLLAVERTPPNELSASEYARNAAMLMQGLGQDVVLVMAKLPSYVRNRLVREGVPFIVPGAQMFLPMLMIDLRERFSKAASRIRDKLSPVSQLVVIYQILGEPVAHIALAQLGQRLAYSPQAVSLAHKELQDAKLCDVRRTGRMIFLEFRLRGRALWEKAEPLMAT